MEASVLIRSGSVPAQLSIASPKSLARSRSFMLSPRSALPVEPKTGIRFAPDLPRRARSDADMIGTRRILSSPSFPATVDEEEEEEVVEYSGGGCVGIARGSSGGDCGNGGDRSKNERISEYYKRMLSADPENPLLLTNYGKFLHEVIGDVRGAEESYGRAVLASPGDAEVLAMYGKLVWGAHGDAERAGAYFRRAVQAAPDDSYVLGWYAHFLWDAEEEDEETLGVTVELVEAF